MDWEYVRPEDAFAGQIWVGISESDAACFTESDLVADEIIDPAACEGDTKLGLVCDLDGEKDIAADFVCEIYADGYALVVCVDRDNEVVDGERKPKNGNPESNGVPDRDSGSGAVLSDS